MYKEKIKAERDNLESIVKKSDKVISFLHNSTLELSKSIGKILHNLVLNVDFDMKDILKKIATEDIKEIHNWIQFFERNEYLKKNKIYRKMSDKLNFFKKLEIPALQDAFNRISNILKNGEKLAQKGEFSILDITNRGNINASIISAQTNRSNAQNRNESLQLEYPINILDELSNDNGMVNVKKETLAELISRLVDKTNNETLNQMNPNQIMESIKKIQLVTGFVIR